MADGALTNPNDTSERWALVRDVVVFQVKMMVDNVRDFALMPVSLGAALLDLVFASRRNDSLFYRVLHWGAHSEQLIDVYSPLSNHPLGQPTVNPSYTIDSVVARLERVVVRECEKGGTATTVKAAMDRAIDQLHRETRPARDKATDLVVRTAEKVREKFDPPTSSPNE